MRYSTVVIIALLSALGLMLLSGCTKKPLIKLDQPFIDTKLFTPLVSSDAIKTSITGIEVTSPTVNLNLPLSTTTKTKINKTTITKGSETVTTEITETDTAQKPKTFLFYLILIIAAVLVMIFKRKLR